MTQLINAALLIGYMEKYSSPSSATGSEHASSKLDGYWGRVFRVINVRPGECTIDGSHKYGAPQWVYDALRGPEVTSATVKEKNGAYMELVGVLWAKWAELDKIREEVETSTDYASPGEDGVKLLQHIKSVQEDIGRFIDAVYEENADFRRDAEKAAWADDWTLRIDSSAGGWGVY